MRFEYRDTVGCDDVGKRVTVRSLRPEGGTTDAVGVLAGCDEATFTMHTRRGRIITVDRRLVIASKVIPPHPTDGPDLPQ